MQKLRNFGILFIITSLCIIFAGCASLNETTSDTQYQNTKDIADTPFTSYIQKFYDKVDTKFGYDLSCQLSTNTNLCDFMLWRTAGSDGEHKTADYLKSKMDEIGLQDVEKIGVTCDKFQLNNSLLTIDGTDISINPGSYAQSGTNGDYNAEIVDCENGLEADYEKVDVAGKIALVKVDLINTAWINLYIRQANEAGAAALITWSDSGLGQLNKDQIPIVNVCCSDLIPTGAISANQALQIKNAIKQGNNICTLNINNIVEPNEGTSYNVIGKISGKSHDSRVILASHYDKYWEGFQNNCTGIGLNLTVAKALLDSNYQPEYDIYFMFSGAGEWGKIDTQADWATGSFGLCETHPEFCNNTTALINCEFAAIEMDDGIGISSVPELKNLLKNFLNQKLIITCENTAINKKINEINSHESCISYRTHGIPCISIDTTGSQWSKNSFQTSSDTLSTYSEKTFNTNINWIGALTIYLDKIPAINIDLSQVSNILNTNINEKNATEAGIKSTVYKSAIEKFSDASKDVNEEIESINKKFNEAYKAKDNSKMESIRNEGHAINKKTLQAFSMTQSAFLKFDEASQYYGHILNDDNVTYIDKTLSSIKNKIIVGTGGKAGARSHISMINKNRTRHFVNFSQAVAHRNNLEYTEEYYEDSSEQQWAWKKYENTIDVDYAASILCKVKKIEEIENLDLLTQSLKDARQQSLKQIATYVNQEISDLNRIADFLLK